jgi:hypothetical protein
MSHRWLTLLLFCACSERALEIPQAGSRPPDPGPPAGAPDLSIRPLADLASARVADLASPPDLAASGFCAGTKVAGTCAQAFFAGVAACWGALDSCTYQITPTGTYTFTLDDCFSSGQHRHTDANGQTHDTQSTWTNAAGTVCLTDSAHYEAGPLTAGGVTLSYDESSGALVCPDGSTFNIGALDSPELCNAVEVILSVHCDEGTCS